MPFSRTEEILEFPQLIEIVRRYVASPLGLAEIEGLRPLSSPAEAEAELAGVAEAMAYLAPGEATAVRAAPPIGFHGLHDVRAAVARLGIEGAELEPVEILQILELLDRSQDVKSALASSGARFPRLAEIAQPIADFRPLLKDLSGKISRDGRLEDHASSALRRIRREIAQQRRAIHESLERFVRAHSEEGALQEEYVTIRNDRLVVPVKAGQKRRIDGVIHAASSTGQTLFVEPLETIQLNNELVRLTEEELAETHRILREMTARLAHSADAIAAAMRTLGRLDVLFARARFGMEFRATVPRFSPAGRPRLHLQRARHPLLEDLLKQRGEAAVPASLTMERGRRVLIISGPNTGGKTVVLKTVGLLALMAKAALPTPADEAEFPWFTEVLADIGDHQSIPDSLSTFSAHMAAVRGMIESATAGSLVLIDEMGAATDPQEGGALSVAVADHFLRAGSFTLVATHLPALKAYGVNTPGVLSASVGFDEETLAPNYQLTVGLPGKSAGLEIARRLGIPAAIIERAQRAQVSHDAEMAALLRELHRRVEQYRAAGRDLERRKEELAEREREIKREWEKKETAKLRELERRVDSMIEKFHAEAAQAIEKIAAASGGRRPAAAAARQAAKAGRSLREEFEAAVLETVEAARASPPVRQAGEGDTVRLRGIPAPGRVLRLLAGGRLEVQVGFMKMQVEAGDVVEILPAAPTRRLPENITFRAAERPDESLTEINVIGATAEEATERVDKFLDTAVLAATPRVRVVHGHGMGVLRRALWEMFASHPHVEKFYSAEQREGGAGATVVELKI
jgi:DNA mismatch repair protein MutS2